MTGVGGGTAGSARRFAASVSSLSVQMRRGFAVGVLVRAFAARIGSPVLAYLRAVRRRGGLPVAHAVPVAVVMTALFTWALVTAASAVRPA